MKFGRAYCEEVGQSLSPYRARRLFTEEDSDYHGKELTFSCQDPSCRVRLTPVGIYMTRKSKRALHFRTRDEHKDGCGFLQPGASGSRVRKPSEREDDFKPTDFPTEFILNPPKRKRTGGGSTVDNDDDVDGPDALDGDGTGGVDPTRRRTSTRTRFLEEVVDCFLSGDERGMAQQFTIDSKTKAFGRFFKKIQYFQDEVGLIYHGAIDQLKVYKDKGVGLRFADPVWVGKKKYRVRAYIPQDRIDVSRRKKAFLAEMAELQKAVDAGEEVLAFFVGAYPNAETIEKADGTSFVIYSAELASVDHLALTFAKA